MLKLLLLAITTARASAFTPYTKRTVVTRMSAKAEARDIVVIGMCVFFIFAYRLQLYMLFLTNSIHIISAGGGIQGTSVAFQLHESSALPKGSTITILESQKIASGKSALVLFYLSYELKCSIVSVIRLLYLNFNCLCLIVFARRMH